MKIVVIGGTGLIGSKLIGKLREHASVERKVQDMTVQKTSLGPGVSHVRHAGSTGG